MTEKVKPSKCAYFHMHPTRFCNGYFTGLSVHLLIQIRMLKPESTLYISLNKVSRRVVFFSCTSLHLTHRNPSTKQFANITKFQVTYDFLYNGQLHINAHDQFEIFKSEAFRMIVDAPWYVPNTVIKRDLQIPTVKEEIPLLQISIQCSPQSTFKWPNSKPHWANRQQAIAKTPAKWSAYQIPSIVVIFAILIFKISIVLSFI
jgi:hypothetical protein